MQIPPWEVDSVLGRSSASSGRSLLNPRPEFVRQAPEFVPSCPRISPLMQRRGRHACPPSPVRVARKAEAAVVVGPSGVVVLHVAGDDDLARLLRKQRLRIPVPSFAYAQPTTLSPPADAVPSTLSNTRVRHSHHNLSAPPSKFPSCQSANPDLGRDPGLGRSKLRPGAEFGIRETSSQGGILDPRFRPRTEPGRSAISSRGDGFNC